MSEKFGVYIPSHNQPVFLRLALLQLLHQSQTPNVVCIFQNGHGDSYEWAVKDVIESLRNHGVEVIQVHTPLKPVQPVFYEVPLRELYNRGCTIFAKMDQDDIFYGEHFRRLLEYLGPFDWAANSSCSLLVLPTVGDYKYKPWLPFKWNPTGANTNTIIFRRKLAAAYLDKLKEHRGFPDDVILSTLLKDTYSFRGVIHNFEPTTCYVSHGKNVSTAHWATDPPPEVL